MDTLDRLLCALAHPVRRKAMALMLPGGELCLCELMAALAVSQPAMSRHMATLRAAGLVRDRRDAQWVRYRLADGLPETRLAVLRAVLNAGGETMAKPVLQECAA